ncbi:hypothetical protein [Persicitalea jodogahamensis]|uniref:Lipoprotein n=1 Tax=Persicitalea jodogahamensis TaxID=402147 RepID=A0A8J3DDY4_9BACT|nr:hypothetical protein [Persicitalea jodogahamensis]GHB88897.1 hypothetical protein GCM10007390_51260 [Persicitalea jodogahamensis]
MKKLISISLLFLAFLCVNCAKVNFPEGIDGKFEVKDMNQVCSRTGTQDAGVQCLRVAAENSTRDKAFGLAKKYAVAAVLLRGVSGTHSATQNPLISRADQDNHGKWINKFFESGDYLKYLEQADIEPNEVFTIKGGYRVGINAKVAYESLNRHLMDEGIIEKPRF